MAEGGFGMHRHDEYDLLVAKMGIRTPEQEESPELHIARDYIHYRKKEEGADIRTDDFLFLFFRAFLNTDPENFEIVRPTAQMLIAKHELACTCEKEEEKAK
jgi:hypothetical protein